MTIYAVFFCSLLSQTCDNSTYPTRTFDSLRACDAVVRLSVPAGPDKQGRYYFGGDRNQWFECRSKHVDQWEAPRQ